MMHLRGYQLRPLQEDELVFAPLGDLENISCKRLFRAWTKRKEKMAEFEAENLLSKYRNENILRLRLHMAPVILTMQGPMELVVPQVKNCFERLWKCPKHRCAKAHELARHHNTRANLDSMRDIILASTPSSSMPTTPTSSAASESKRSSSDKDGAATIAKRQGSVKHAKAGMDKPAYSTTLSNRKRDQHCTNL